MKNDLMNQKPKISEEEYKKIPKQAREMGGFIYLVIDAALGSYPHSVIETDIRCFKKGCFGTIDTDYDFLKNIVHWKCNKCVVGGSIDINSKREIKP
jgi:hypothetical protein